MLAAQKAAKAKQDKVQPSPGMRPNSAIRSKQQPQSRETS